MVTITFEQKYAYQVSARPTVLLRPLALYSALGLLFSIAVVASTGINGLDRSDAAFTMLLWAFVSGIWILMTVPRWFWQAGRTTYRIAGDTLAVLRGSKTIQEIPCRDIYRARMEGNANWHHLLTPFNIEGGQFPRLVLWTRERIELPPIALWGDAAAKQTELELQQAIRGAGNGAVISPNL